MGRATVFVVGFSVIVALVLGVATMAFAANGDPWILGQSNAVTAITKLAGGGGVDGPMLQLTNNDAGPDDTALDLNVQSNEPPMTINSSTKVGQLNADRLDGLSSGAFAAAYESTVVVSPVGTNAQNGQALLDALASITDASASKPYLLYIEPGTYDLGTDSLTMKPFVDIEGSGELNTVITSEICTGAADSGTVEGADNTEMRFFTAQNTATGEDCTAILNSSASTRLTHVTAEATGEGENQGVENVEGATVTMTDVTATASGAPDLTSNVGVMISENATATIRQSKLSGGSIINQQGPNPAALWQTGGSAKVALSQLVGAFQIDGGTLQCFNNYDESMAPVTCPS